MPTHHEQLMVIGTKMTDILMSMFNEVAEESGGKLVIDRDIEYHEHDEHNPSIGIVSLIGNLKDENNEDDKVFTLRVVSHKIPDDGYTHLIVRNSLIKNDEATYHNALRLVNEMNGEVLVSQCLLQSSEIEEGSEGRPDYAIAIHTAIDDETPDTTMNQVLEMYLSETLHGLREISHFNRHLSN